MVSTIKFSQFANANIDDDTNSLVGLSGGLNAKGPTVNRWTSATRPNAPFDGLSGYNLDLHAWEFWNASLSEWLQFVDTAFNPINWSIVTAASVIADVNSGIITNRSTTPVQILLPATFEIGDEVLVMGLGTAGWSLVCNTGQQMVFGSLATSVDGSINSDIQYANLFVRGLVPDTKWTVTLTNSNPSII